ncbi:hypothetical protein B0H13DRAFT_2375083 [Mycena leptocephala]|nr:hypothetical protein B0H13DRAFT_2375083 [Mycena leptocephala]
MFHWDLEDSVVLSVGEFNKSAAQEELARLHAAERSLSPPVPKKRNTVKGASKSGVGPKVMDSTMKEAELTLEDFLPRKSKSKSKSKSGGDPAGKLAVAASPTKVKRVKRKFGDEDDEDSDTAAPAERPAASDTVQYPSGEIISDIISLLGAIYDPRVLEDYGGPYFQHINAKLVQLDIRDADNKLIPPWKQYSALRPGSFVLVLATIHIFIFKDASNDRSRDRKFMQLSAHTIRVLDESELPVHKRTRPIPRTMTDEQAPTTGPSTPGRSSATSAFNSELSQAYPPSNLHPRSTPISTHMASAVPDETPETASDIDRLSRFLKTQHRPIFCGFKYGFLYATQCKSRRVVPIPIDYGFDQHVRLSTVEDLFTECWVPSSLPPNISNSSIGRLHVTTFPLNSGILLEFPYTVFYIPQNALPPQTQVTTCPYVVRAGTPWHGNILVVRHGKRDLVIGMDKWDGRLVDVIVARLVKIGNMIYDLLLVTSTPRPSLPAKNSCYIIF